MEVSVVNRTGEVREVKLIAIGNSKGIRIPKAMLDKYGWSGWLVLEEAEEGVFLRGRDSEKMSWEDTYRAMAAEAEDWSEMEVAVSDGIE